MNNIKSKAKFWLALVAIVASSAFVYYSLEFKPELLFEATRYIFVVLPITLFFLAIIVGAFLFLRMVYREVTTNKKELK